MHKQNLFFLLVGVFLTATIFYFVIDESHEHGPLIDNEPDKPALLAQQDNKPNDDHHTHHEEGITHTHNDVNSSNTGELVEAESTPHSHKVSDIKKKMCENPEGECTIKESISIEQEIIDESLKLAKSQEVGIILSSNNFNHVIQRMSDTKISTEFIELQDDLNQQLANEYLQVESEGVFCSDVVCGASFRYDVPEDWNAFQKDFLKKNKDLGNLFIAHVGNETRVIFLPDDESKGVIR